MKFLKAIMIAGLLTMSGSVLAHTGIKSTYPANEQILEAAPKQLTLNFGAPVRLMKVTEATFKFVAVDDVTGKPTPVPAVEDLPDYAPRITKYVEE